MPIYNFGCEACGWTGEELAAMGAQTAQCPECGHMATRGRVALPFGFKHSAKMVALEATGDAGKMKSHVESREVAERVEKGESTIMHVDDFRDVMKANRERAGFA